MMEGRRAAAKAGRFTSYLTECGGDWIGFMDAAILVGCSGSILRAAMRRGEITRRQQQPALLRSDVDAFAGRWRAKQADKGRG